MGKNLKVDIRYSTLTKKRKTCTVVIDWEQFHGCFFDEKVGQDAARAPMNGPNCT